MKRFSHILQANLPLLVALALLWPAGWFVQSSGAFDSYVVRILMTIGIWVTAAVSLQLINGISGQFSLGHAGFVAIGAYAAAYPSVQFSQGLARPFSALAFFIAIAMTIALVVAAVAGIYFTLHASRKLYRHLPGILTVLLLASVVYDLKTADDPTALHLIPWTSAFSGLGAQYSLAESSLVPFGDRLSAMLPLGFARILCLLFLLIGGGLFAAAAGLLVGVPSLRLKGDYLAIATLGFAEIVRVMLESSDVVGGALGITGVPQIDPLFQWQVFSQSLSASFILVYGLAIVAIATVWRISRSARGRALIAVREDEIAASAVGINPAHMKVFAFTIGAFLAGAAGAMFAHYEGYVTPSHFGFMRSIELIVIVTLAGTGSISGTIVVAAVLTWLPEFLRDPVLWVNTVTRPLGLTVTLPAALDAAMDVLADNRMILYSLVLILLMLLRPNGLLGSREIFNWRRKAAARAA